jgi:hypothetical protein
MSTYEIRFRSGDRLLQSQGPLECKDDIDALDAVKEMLRAVHAEIWHSGRLLGRVKPDGTSLPAEPF